MANKDTISRINSMAKGILGYDKPDMIRRDAWGSSINFDDAKPDYARAFFIADILSGPEVDLVPEEHAGRLVNDLRQIHSALDSINAFRVEEGGGADRRNEAIRNLRRWSEELLANWSGTLALINYRRGSFSTHLAAAEAAAKKAAENTKLTEQVLVDAKGALNSEVDSVKSMLTAIQRERETVITAARAFSAETAAAGHRTAYPNRAALLESSATRWLVASVSLALLTLVAAALVWWFSRNQGTSANEFLPSLGPKMVILGIFFTATVWCGRNYRSLQHEAAVYTHRSVSLDVFPVLLAAAPDRAKETVLLEATRSLFTSSPSAWSQDSDHKLVEIVQSGLPRGNG